MTLATFAAGPYSATYNADTAAGNPPGKSAGPRDLGLVENVRRWRRSYQAHPVGTSLLGGTLIDGVYRGGACYCQMTFKEWLPVVHDVLWPFSAGFGEVGAVGQLLSDLAGTLTLTAQVDTPADAAGPRILTFGKAILAPDHNSEVALGAIERDVPVVFLCLPYLSASGKVVWFEELEPEEEE